MHNALQQLKFTAKYFTIYTVSKPAALRENLTKAAAPEETASDLEHPGVSWGLTDSETESDLESKTDIKVTFTLVATRRDRWLLLLINCSVDFFAKNERL